MKLQVTFKQLNPNFSQKLADEFNFGEEDIDNCKTDWSCMLVSELIMEYKLIQQGEYKLKGKMEDVDFEFLIPNMSILQYMTLQGEIREIAVSKKLIKKTHNVYNSKSDTTRFYFYFNGSKEFINPHPTAYIHFKDYPKELLEPVN